MCNNPALEAFIKNFNITTNLSDVQFRSVQVEPYHSLDKGHQFGEKTCLLYTVDLTAYNVEILLKILSFDYESHVEALKLEINIKNEMLAKEMTPCRNFLQRKRHVNTVFQILIKAVKLHEMRRLICETIFQRYIKNVTAISRDDGVHVKCLSYDSRMKYLEFRWAIVWRLDEYDVSDFIEFFCNDLVLERKCGKLIRLRLNTLVQANLDFHTKLKLWRSLMYDLYNSYGEKKVGNPSNEKTPILEISDSSDSGSEDSVIEIDQSFSPRLLKQDDVLVIE